MRYTSLAVDLEIFGAGQKLLNFSVAGEDGFMDRADSEDIFGESLRDRIGSGQKGRVQCRGSMQAMVRFT
jgi:hypothetical protein